MAKSLDYDEMLYLWQAWRKATAKLTNLFKSYHGMETEIAEANSTYIFIIINLCDHFSDKLTNLKRSKFTIIRGYFINCKNRIFRLTE